MKISKFTSRITSHSFTTYLSQQDIFSVVEIVIISKVLEYKHSKLQYSTQLRVGNVGHLRSNFTGGECFLESLSCDILVLCEANLSQSISYLFLQKKKSLRFLNSSLIFPRPSFPWQLS